MSRLGKSWATWGGGLVWLYLRFTLSVRDVEDLLAERGAAVSYETVRRWVNHFGPMIAADLRKRRLKPHTTWHLDEVYLKIDGRMVPSSRQPRCFERKEKVSFLPVSVLGRARPSGVCSCDPSARTAAV